MIFCHPFRVFRGALCRFSIIMSALRALSFFALNATPEGLNVNSPGLQPWVANSPSAGGAHAIAVQCTAPAMHRNNKRVIAAPHFQISAGG